MVRDSLKIAVLDDEAGMRNALRRLLQAHGFEVVTYSAGVHLLEAIAADDPNCLVLDLHMPGMTGFDILATMRAKGINVPVIVVSGHDEPQNAARVHSLGASAYLTKPLDESWLLSAIATATNPPR